MALLVVSVLMVVMGGLMVMEIAEGILMEGLMYRLRKSGHRVMEISQGVMEISWVVMGNSRVVREERRGAGEDVAGVEVGMWIIVLW